MKIKNIAQISKKNIFIFKLILSENIYIYIFNDGVIIRINSPLITKKSKSKAIRLIIRLEWFLKTGRLTSTNNRTNYLN